MIEYTVCLQNGETDFIYGYNWTDALRRANLTEQDIAYIIDREYID